MNRLDEQQTQDNIEEIDLQKYWFVLKRNWLPALASFILVSGAASISAFSAGDNYRAEGKVLYKSDSSSALTGFDQTRGKVEVLTFQAEPLETQAEVVKSLAVMKSAISSLDLRNTEVELEANDLLEEVEVVPVPNTQVLHISYESDDPALASAVVNQVISAYYSQNIYQNREEAATVRRFIQEQLPAIKAKVEFSESALREFKESSGVISLEQEAADAITVLSSLTQEIIGLQAQRSDVGAQLSNLQAQLGMEVSTALEITALNQSEGVQKALTDVQAVQTLIADEKSRYLEGNPTISSLKSKKGELESVLDQRIQEILGRQDSSISSGALQLGQLRQDLISNTIKDLRRLQVEDSGLSNRLTNLEQSFIRYKQRVDAFPMLENKERTLERDLQATQATYETLLNQLQELQVIENQTVGNVTILSLADIPSEAVGPNRKLILAGGSLLGLLLALSVAFALDLLDRSIKDVKEIKELFNLRLLSSIPFMKGTNLKSSLLGESHSQSTKRNRNQEKLRDAYNLLYANLSFQSSKATLKSIIISSAVSGEGKSEVSTNLAITISQLGQRVLLIDADLRSPQQHIALDLNNSTGLSNVLVEQVSIEYAIQKKAENLDVLTSGTISSNPVALLDSRRMKLVLQELSNQYDVVLLDSPPIIGCADPLILGKEADGLLLVVRPGMVGYEQSYLIEEALEQSNQNVLGMVINGVHPEHGDSGTYLKHTNVNRDEKLPLMPSQDPFPEKLLK